MVLILMVRYHLLFRENRTGKKQKRNFHIAQLAEMFLCKEIDVNTLITFQEALQIHWNL